MPLPGITRPVEVLLASSGDGSWWDALGALRASVTSGEPAFERAGLRLVGITATHSTLSVVEAQPL